MSLLDRIFKRKAQEVENDFNDAMEKLSEAERKMKSLRESKRIDLLHRELRNLLVDYRQLVNEKKYLYLQNHDIEGTVFQIEMKSAEIDQCISEFRKIDLCDKILPDDKKIEEKKCVEETIV